MEDRNPDEEGEGAQTGRSVEGTDEGAVPLGVLQLDYVFRALAHSRRRYLLYTLKERSRWTLTDLATKIAAWEDEIAEEAVTGEARDRVYISLYHAHVPKLVEDGIVTFDREAETIGRGEHASQVLAALEGVGASLDAGQESHARREFDAGNE
ncbi:DUF7344 domain-containing protein [Halomarina pelagica]|uniref:DUF7344 domain-containing protein n=1 Tax=Halomarina pelagica TaxID=2961599 RepID=UPI0020C2AC53|nr:hypothetical protein [Halomarina sp. BND7]